MVGRLLVAQEKTEVIFFLLSLDTGWYLFLSKGIVEAEMLRYRALASSGHHWKRCAQLSVKLVNYGDYHFYLLQ